MAKSIFRAIAELEDQGKCGALCTIIQSQGSTPRHSSAKLLVFEDGTTLGSVGGGEVEARTIAEALLAIQEKKSRLLGYNMVNPQQGDPGICGGSVQIYVEPILLSPTIVIVGGGHVGKAVAHLARWLNYRVVVSDDRPEFCTPKANPDAQVFYQGDMKELPKQMQITAQTYLVLTTRGSSVDVEGLPALLDTRAAYIGIIGSKRRWSVTRKALVEIGIPAEKLDRIVSPIGLELNAETPEEIAVSIMAEIMMLHNGGSGQPMRIRK